MNKLKFLSGNALKIIATILMVVDHVGYIIFPNVLILRIIGRISYPIFAFMIAEGTKYTKNKLKYFLLIFGCGALYQLFLWFYMQETLMGIFITFSFSIIICYSIEFFKKTLLVYDFKPVIKVLSGVLVVGAFALTYIANCYLDIDYGFFGCITPAIVSICYFNGKGFIGKNLSPAYDKIKILDNNIIAVLLLALSLIGVWLTGVHYTLRNIQPFSFIAIVLLLFYNGKRGKAKLKYFFYIFYPLHLVLLYGIAMLI